MLVCNPYTSVVDIRKLAIKYNRRNRRRLLMHLDSEYKQYEFVHVCDDCISSPLLTIFTGRGLRVFSCS